MGPDAHIGSLFPNRAATAETERYAPSVAMSSSFSTLAFYRGPRAVKVKSFGLHHRQQVSKILSELTLLCSQVGGRGYQLAQAPPGPHHPHPPRHQRREEHRLLRRRVCVTIKNPKKTKKKVM